jgi:hypothetical protein
MRRRMRRRRRRRRRSRKCWIECGMGIAKLGCAKRTKTRHKNQKESRGDT